MDKIQEILCDLGMCSKHSIQLFHSKVRDRDDVSVMRCADSGVIVLSRSDHMGMAHYAAKDDFDYWSGGSRDEALAETLMDDRRRSRQFGELVIGKAWLDVGTGAGGILDELSPVAATTEAVEPQGGARRVLRELGYTVHAGIGDAPDHYFDVATLFHVFEHFCEPLDALTELRAKLKSAGNVVVEVPHANDFLLSFLNLESFKDFTFWSEHLILHTRASLTKFLERAGFRDIDVVGYQRYPLANHLYWLSKGQPGGHKIWAQLRTPELDASYASMLARLDRTDTLIATASA